MSEIKLYNPKNISSRKVLLRTLLYFWEQTTIELAMEESDSNMIYARVNFHNKITNKKTTFHCINNQKNHPISADSYSALEQQLKTKLSPAFKLISIKKLLQPVNMLGPVACILSCPE